MIDLNIPKSLPNSNGTFENHCTTELNSVQQQPTSDSNDSVPTLLPHHIQSLLDESGLDTAILKAAKLWSISSEEASRLFGQEESGVVFPYFDFEGNGIGHRLKIDEPREKLKYLEYSTGTYHLACYFLTVNIGNLNDPRVTLVVTEGEKKLLAVAQAFGHENYAFAAFPGCRNWKGKKEGHMAEQWEVIPLKDRRVWLIPDTDFFTNQNVYQPICNFIRALCIRGAIVSLVDLRQGDQR